MLQKRNVDQLISRSLPKRNHQFNKIHLTSGLHPKFTSLTSKKFHPYLIGLDINYLREDFHTKINVALSGWKKLISRLYSKRVVLSYILASSLLLTVTSRADYPNWLNSNLSYTHIAEGKSNPVQMDALIVASATPHFQWPVDFDYISTFYSFWHPGIDLPDSYGAPVNPTSTGTVVAVETGWFGYGKSVVIAHVDNYTSRYAHLSKINVTVGDNVNNDTVIGNVGSTGRSTGNHLHFEIYSGDRTVNPLNVLPTKDVAVAVK